jgi:hypothetical protein
LNTNFQWLAVEDSTWRVGCHHCRPDNDGKILERERNPFLLASHHRSNLHRRKFVHGIELRSNEDQFALAGN